MGFVKATRKQKPGKILLQGTSGAGKTFTALSIAKGMAQGERFAVIDTENGSSTLYSDDFGFDVMVLKDFSVKNYISALSEAAEAGYKVVVVDSISHSWEWLLEEAENVQRRQKTQNSWTAWKEVTPIYNQLIKAIVQAPIHVVCTARSKTEYVLEEYERNGKTCTKPKRVGLAPIFRSGGEFEFDILATLDQDHVMVVEKSRYRPFADKVIHNPTEAVGKEIAEWLAGGAVVEPPKPLTLAECETYRIKSNCSKKDQLLGFVYTEDSAWLRKVAGDLALLEKLSEEDRTAILRYVELFTEMEKENVG